MQKIKLVISRLPNFISELRYSNEFLKIFSIASLTVSILSIIVGIASLSRAPVVLSFSKAGELISEDKNVNAEEQVRAALKNYISLRYNWSPQTIDKQLKSAESFVASKAKDAFDSAKGEILKFSREKGVAQKVYVDSVAVDLSKENAEIRGERLSLIQGMRAAAGLKLILEFSSGKRTHENPWGVYVIKEKEIMQ